MCIKKRADPGGKLPDLRTEPAPQLVLLLSHWHGMKRSVVIFQP